MIGQLLPVIPCLTRAFKNTIKLYSDYEKTVVKLSFDITNAKEKIYILMEKGMSFDQAHSKCLSDIDERYRRQLEIESLKEI